MTTKEYKVVRYEGRELLQSPAWLRQEIDKLGSLSGVAQKLDGPITSYDRCLYGSVVLYVVFNECNEGLGLLKVGNKQLFLEDKSGQGLRQVDCQCVLDFYVKNQRQGLGGLLFEAMLAGEMIEARTLALDRPSEKFLAFMNKNYNLRNFRHQANKFVVFDEFWDDNVVSAMKPSKERFIASSYSTTESFNASSGPPVKMDFRRKRIPFN